MILKATHLIFTNDDQSKALLFGELNLAYQDVTHKNIGILGWKNHVAKMIESTLVGKH